MNRRNQLTWLEDLDYDSLIVRSVYALVDLTVLTPSDLLYDFVIVLRATATVKSKNLLLTRI